MNVNELIQTIVNVIAVSIAVFSVLILVRQTRQLEATLRSQVYQSLIDTSLKIDQLLIEHPEFRKYIYDNEPISEDMPDLDRLMGVMEFMIDVIDNIKAHEQYIPEPHLSGWRNFSEVVVSSPAGKYFLNKYKYWFPNIPRR